MRENEKIRLQDGHKTAVICFTQEWFDTEPKYYIDFYYDGYPDYEWKRGAHGIAGTSTDTLSKAKATVKRYFER